MSKNKHRTGFRGPSPDVGKATQFKPGQSGNPGGRPRTRALAEAYRAKLAEPVPGDPDGRTYAEVIADGLALAALKGNVRAAQELGDRSEGRPKQQLEVEAEVGTNWATILMEAERRVKAYEAEKVIEGEVVKTALPGTRAAHRSSSSVSLAVCCG